MFARRHLREFVLWGKVVDRDVIVDLPLVDNLAVLQIHAEEAVGVVGALHDMSLSSMCNMTFLGANILPPGVATWLMLVENSRWLSAVCLNTPILSPRTTNERSTLARLQAGCLTLPSLSSSFGFVFALVLVVFFVSLSVARVIVLLFFLVFLSASPHAGRPLRPRSPNR